MGLTHPHPTILRVTLGTTPTVLAEIIRYGSDFQARMPSFGERLSEPEVEAIFEFLKASLGAEKREYQRLANHQDQARRP